MIIGAHSIIYSRNPEADRALLRDVFQLPHVDVGGGWLIFGLPPAEIAVHPSEKNDVHEFYLMVEDIEAFIKTMEGQSVPCGPVRTEGWGLLTQLQLPGGGKIGVYQPRHPRPAMTAKKSTKKATKPAGKSTRKPKTKKKTTKPKRR